ncbi:MAG: histidine kinase [Saprospiraceae bacterium]|nr:histidine kinase [Saprospiraceae bacterium]
MKTNTEAIHFLHALVSNVDSGIVSFNIEGYITLINKKALEYLNIYGDVGDVIDKAVLDIINIEELHKLIYNCLTKSRKNFHLSNVLHDDRYLILDGKKLLDGMLLSITDITADVLAKDRATQSLLLGQETERKRLAKEIHDGVGPNMSTLKLQIDSIKRKLNDNDAISALDKVNEAISEIATDIRQISHDLMPSSLIDFGVVTALSNFSNRITETGEVQVVYNSNIEDGYLTKEHELNIFRIVQELVNNALKYSKCGTIEISLQEVENKLIIAVIDDGDGMEADTSKSGIGLHNINSRVDSLQGTISIDSEKGNGVSAIIELPIKSNEK